MRLGARLRQSGAISLGNSTATVGWSGSRETRLRSVHTLGTRRASGRLGRGFGRRRGAAVPAATAPTRCSILSQRRSPDHRHQTDLRFCSLYGIRRFASSLDAAVVRRSRPLIAHCCCVDERPDARDATARAPPQYTPSSLTLNARRASTRVRCKLRNGLPREFFPATLSATRRAVRAALAEREKPAPASTLACLDRAVDPVTTSRAGRGDSNLSRYDGVRTGIARPVEDFSSYRNMAPKRLARGKRRSDGTYVRAMYYDAITFQAQKLRRMISDDFELFH